MPVTTSDFDFRRPNKLGREIARGMDLLHEVFARRVGTAWGSELRAYVQVESAGLVQLPYDDVIRSMPNPNVLVVAEPYPLPGAFVVEIDLQLGMLLVDRLLGSEHVNAIRGVRRPTEVELELLGHLGQQAVLALTEVLGTVGVTEPRMRAVEVNPQVVQVAAPSEPALLVVFQVRVSGPLEAAGTISMIYPTALMSALLEHVASLRAEATERAIDLGETQALLAGLGAADVELAVRLHDSRVAAADIRGLAVGDVLRLDHRVGRPAVAVAGDTPVLDVHLGRVGPRRAAQVARWRAAGSGARARHRRERPPARGDHAGRRPAAVARERARTAAVPGGHAVSPADDTQVAPAALPDLGQGVGPGAQQELDLLADVSMDVTVELGQVRMRVSDLLRLGEGTVIELDRAVTAPVDVLVNGSLVARGDVVVVGDELGVRITEIVRRGGA